MVGVRNGDRPLCLVLILQTRDYADLEWYVASPDLFNDVINKVIDDLTLSDADPLRAYVWSDEKHE